MKILISGATGFIGKHLTKALTKKGVEVYIVTTSTNKVITLPSKRVHHYKDTLSLIDFMKENRPDGVIHLASMFLTSHTSSQVDELMKANIALGASLLEASQVTSVPWFINTGTFTQHYQNKHYSPVNLYSATKQAFQDIAQYYSENTNLTVVTLKLFDTFGEEDTRPKVFALWTKIANTNEPLLMSPGKQIIDMNYVGNVVDAYLHMAKLLAKKDRTSHNGKNYLVTQGERMTLQDLAKLFETTTKKKLPIVWGGRPYRDKEVMKPWDKDTILPGWKPKVSLAKAIRLLFT